MMESRPSAPLPVSSYSLNIFDLRNIFKLQHIYFKTLAWEEKLIIIQQWSLCMCACMYCLEFIIKNPYQALDAFSTEVTFPS